MKVTGGEYSLSEGATTFGVKVSGETTVLDLGRTETTYVDLVSGTLNVSNGTVIVMGGDSETKAAGTGTLNVTGGTVYAYGTFTSITNDGGTLYYGGRKNDSGDGATAKSVAPDTLTLNSGSVTLYQDATISGNGGTVDYGGNSSITATISGNGGFTVNGSDNKKSLTVTGGDVTAKGTFNEVKATAGTLTIAEKNNSTASSVSTLTIEGGDVTVGANNQSKGVSVTKTVQSGGTLTAAGAEGKATALGTYTVTGGTFSFNQYVTLNTNKTLTVNNASGSDVTINVNATGESATNTLGSVTKQGAGKLTINGDVSGDVSNSGTGDVKVTGDVTGDVSSTGECAVTVGGSVKTVSASAGSVTVGSVSGTSADDTTVNVSASDSGSITVKGDVNGSVSNTGSGDVSVTSKVNGNVTNSGTGKVTVTGTNVNEVKTVGGDVTNSGGDVTVTGDVGGKVENTGTGKVTVTGSVLTVSASAGSATVGSVTGDNGTEQNNPDDVVASGSGSITVNGAVGTTGGAHTVKNSGSGDVVVTGKVTGSAESTGSGSLTLSGGATGSVTFSGTADTASATLQGAFGTADDDTVNVTAAAKGTVNIVANDKETTIKKLTMGTKTGEEQSETWTDNESATLNIGATDQGYTITINETEVHGGTLNAAGADKCATTLGDALAKVSVSGAKKLKITGNVKPEGITSAGATEVELSVTNATGAVVDVPGGETADKAVKLTVDGSNYKVYAHGYFTSIDVSGTGNKVYIGQKTPTGQVANYANTWVSAGVNASGDAQVFIGGDTATSGAKTVTITDTDDKIIQISGTAQVTLDKNATVSKTVESGDNGTIYAVHNAGGTFTMKEGSMIDMAARGTNVTANMIAVYNTASSTANVESGTIRITNNVEGNMSSNPDIGINSFGTLTLGVKGVKSESDTAKPVIDMATGGIGMELNNSVLTTIYDADIAVEGARALYGIRTVSGGTLVIEAGEESTATDGNKAVEAKLPTPTVTVRMSNGAADAVALSIEDAVKWTIQGAYRTAVFEGVTAAEIKSNQAKDGTVAKMLTAGRFIGAVKFSVDYTDSTTLADLIPVGYYADTSAGTNDVSIVEEVWELQYFMENTDDQITSDGVTSARWDSTTGTYKMAGDVKLSADTKSYFGALDLTTGNDNANKVIVTQKDDARTLDLNGHTLTGASGKDVITTYVDFTVENTADAEGKINATVNAGAGNAIVLAKPTVENAVSGTLSVNATAGDITITGAKGVSAAAVDANGAVYILNTGATTDVTVSGIDVKGDVWISNKSGGVTVDCFTEDVVTNYSIRTNGNVTVNNGSNDAEDTLVPGDVVFNGTVRGADVSVSNYGYVTVNGQFLATGKARIYNADDFTIETTKLNAIEAADGVTIYNGRSDETAHNETLTLMGKDNETAVPGGIKTTGGAVEIVNYSGQDLSIGAITTDKTEANGVGGDVTIRNYGDGNVLVKSSDVLVKSISVAGGADDKNGNVSIINGEVIDKYDDETQANTITYAGAGTITIDDTADGIVANSIEVKNYGTSTQAIRVGALKSTGASTADEHGVKVYNVNEKGMITIGAANGGYAIDSVSTVDIANGSTAQMVIDGISAAGTVNVNNYGNGKIDVKKGTGTENIAITNADGELVVVNGFAVVNDPEAANARTFTLALIEQMHEIVKTLPSYNQTFSDDAAKLAAIVDDLKTRYNANDNDAASEALRNEVMEKVFAQLANAASDSTGTITIYDAVTAKDVEAYNAGKGDILFGVKNGEGVFNGKAVTASNKIDIQNSGAGNIKAGDLTATGADGDKKVSIINEAEGTVETGTITATNTNVTIDNNAAGKVATGAITTTTSGDVTINNKGNGTVTTTKASAAAISATGAVKVTNGTATTDDQAVTTYSGKGTIKIDGTLGSAALTLTNNASIETKEVNGEKIPDFSTGTITVTGDISASGEVKIDNKASGVINTKAVGAGTNAVGITNGVAITDKGYIELGAITGGALTMTNNATVLTIGEAATKQTVPDTGTIKVTGDISASDNSTITNKDAGNIITAKIGTTGSATLDIVNEKNGEITIAATAESGTVAIAPAGKLTIVNGGSKADEAYTANAGATGAITITATGAESKAINATGAVDVKNMSNGEITITGAGETPADTIAINAAGAVSVANGMDNAQTASTGLVLVQGNIGALSLAISNYSNGQEYTYAENAKLEGCAVGILGTVKTTSTASGENDFAIKVDNLANGLVVLVGDTDATGGKVTITNGKEVEAGQTANTGLVVIGNDLKAKTLSVTNNSTGVASKFAYTNGHGETVEIPANAAVIFGDDIIANENDAAVTITNSNKTGLIKLFSEAVVKDITIKNAGKVESDSINASGNVVIDNAENAEDTAEIVITGDRTTEDSAEFESDILDGVKVVGGSLTIGEHGKGKITIKAVDDGGNGVYFNSSNNDNAKLKILNGTIDGKGTGYGLNVVKLGTADDKISLTGTATYNSVTTELASVYGDLLGNTYDWATTADNGKTKTQLPRTLGNYKRDDAVRMAFEANEKGNNVRYMVSNALTTPKLTVAPSAAQEIAKNGSLTLRFTEAAMTGAPYIVSAEVSGSAPERVTFNQTASSTSLAAGGTAGDAETITFTDAYAETVNLSVTVKEATVTPPSGGSVAPAPTPTVSLSGDDNSVSIGVTTKDSTATMSEPKAADLDKVIGAGVETGEVVIDMSSLNSSIDTATIPTKTFDAIEAAVTDASNDADELTIKLPGSSVTFNAAALDAIADQATGSSISLEVSKDTVSKLATAQQNAVKALDVQDVYSITLTSGGKTISDFNGGSATVSVNYTLKAGQNAKGIVVWYVANDGTLTEVPATFSAGKVTFTVSHFSNYVIAYDAERAAACPQDSTCPIAAFSDADAKAWYHDGVHWALENGAMSGMGNGTFAPNGTTTRAMVAQILWNLEGKPAYVGMSEYTDVDNDDWFGPAVRWASAEGIVTGYDGKFAPNDPVTREQLATMLYRYAQYKNIDVSVGEDTNILSYEDAFNVNTWAMAAMQWACGAGVMNGVAANGTMYLQPQNDATRAVVATMIARFCTEVAK